MSKAIPFRIDVPEEKIDAIHERVRTYNWFPAPENEDGFTYGMSTKVMKDLQGYWLAGYDWRKQETLLNKYPSFKAKVDDLDIHFVHVVGEAAGSRPLLLTHGWPGSFFEFWEAVGPLAFPSKHGGNKEDAFDLVIPSLPGYGFSEKPRSPIGQRATAALWDKLMREILGYDTYLAQGGDWGGIVTSFLGLNHGAHDGKGGCKAIHLNMVGLSPSDPTPQSDEEAAWVKLNQQTMQAEGAYMMEQMTKPQTLAMALMDSPVGTAAWILEKFHGWSDLTEKPLLEVYSKDQLLTNVMIYLVNDAIATSVWYYNAMAQEGGITLIPGQICDTPTAFAHYPNEGIIKPPPRSWLERIYNLTRWTSMPRGGHFAAMEEPDLFVEDVRAWAGELS